MKLICPPHWPSPARVHMCVHVRARVSVFSKKLEGSVSTSARELWPNSVSRDRRKLQGLCLLHEL